MRITLKEKEIYYNLMPRIVREGEPQTRPPKELHLEIQLPGILPEGNYTLEVKVVGAEETSQASETFEVHHAH